MLRVVDDDCETFDRDPCRDRRRHRLGVEGLIMDGVTLSAVIVFAIVALAAHYLATHYGPLAQG